MNWSESTWQKTQPIYNSILKLPFIKSLADGTLTADKFEFYIQQDALYLEHFARVLALIGAKSKEIDHGLAFVRFAEQALVVEREIHESYFKFFNVKQRGEMQPVCHSYVHYLKSVIGFESIEMATAATLPCFWIYMQVGQHLLKHAQLENNPYKKWIESYASEDFEKTVQKAIDICDVLASKTTEDTRKSMTEAFLMAAHFECEFWSAAQNNIVWKTY